MAKPSISSRLLRSLWQNGGTILLPVVLMYYKPHGSGFWYRTGMAVAVSWIGISFFVSGDLNNRLKMICCGLFVASSAALWMLDSWRVSMLVFLPSVGLCVWAGWLAPPRKPERSI